MHRAIRAYFGALKAILVVSLGLMVVLVFGNVLLRYLFNAGITVADELSRFCFVLVTFLGAILTIRERAHLGVDSVVKRLSPAGRRVCFGVAQVLMMIPIALFLQGSWEQMQINMSVRSPVIGYSMGLFYGIGVVFSVSVLLILASVLWRFLAGRLDEKALAPATEASAAQGTLQPPLAGAGGVIGMAGKERA
ncbi:TRAP transporter small permease [Verticiella sediminum]|uniref:TRAP transporter small permease protein n=1 Tax=Verticiella sediminum TaxID=1247510 RepID=A0A556AYV4_9BURK|nr:TRAP transporter small permease [Verticiella sediminum]TSH97615.1 TRAP transporter small permease [Verticiella sediminum]